MNKMNLPNKLTIFRVILILPFVVILLGGEAGWFGANRLIPDLIALAIFIVASLTDLIDGKIARKYNLVTNFGKFMDPLADKLLVCAALIAHQPGVYHQRLPADCRGQQCGHCGKLLGKIQDHFSDGDGVSYDR